MLFPPFFFHFEMYEKAKKHPILGHVGVTYCLYMQLVGIVAVFLITVWGVIQHYANQRGTALNPWVPWGLTDCFNLFLRTVCVFAPVMLLLSLLPYRYVKKEIEAYEKEKEEKKKKKQDTKKVKENSHEEK